MGSLNKFMLKISVLINTLNEEKNIGNCLNSVKWADEIIIVDMHSEDNTVNIAKQFTDKIFYFEKMGYADPARQFGLSKTTNEWVLTVDADELVTISLFKAITQIAETGIYDAVLIPRKNYFFGEEMRGTGWSPLQDRQLRFFKRNVLQYNDQIHNFLTIRPEAKILNFTDENCCFVNFNFIDVEHYLEKLNRYTTIEAKTYFLKKKNVSFIRFLFLAIKDFFVRFFLKGGYKDGVQGLALSILMAGYRITTSLKLFLMKKYETSEINPIIFEKYQKISRETLKEYETSSI